MPSKIPARVIEQAKRLNPGGAGARPFSYVASRVTVNMPRRPKQAGSIKA